MLSLSLLSLESLLSLDRAEHPALADDDPLAVEAAEDAVGVGMDSSPF